MCKKNYRFSCIIFSLILFVLIGCNNSMPDDLAFEEEMGSDFVTFLTSEKGKTYFNIHSQSNNAIDFTHRLRDTNELFHATVGVSDNLNIVAIARNDLDPFGYDLYQVDSHSVTKKGFIEGGVGQVILVEDTLYAIQYNHIRSHVHLYQYAIDDLTQELNSWKIPGIEVSDLKYNAKEKTLYMTSFGEQSTYLSTIKNDVFQEKEIFSRPYSTNLLITEDSFLVSQGRQVNNGYKEYGTIYELKEDRIKHFIQTELPPSQMIYNQEKLFVVSGNVNRPAVEIYELDSKRKLAHLNVGEPLWGTISLTSGVHLYTPSGVFGIDNLRMIKLLTHQNEAISKINLNMYHY